MMTGVCNQADDIGEATSWQTCYVVLERPPSHYISRNVEFSEPQTRHDTARNDTTESSDSGSSIFITQKPTPGRVRTRHRHRKTRRSPKDVAVEEESEDDYLFSASPQEAATYNKRKKIKMPYHMFPFVKKNQWMGKRTLLTGRQNLSLHNATMGGFFKCVRDLWEDNSGVYRDSLPTVDIDGEFISPLSEEEEERSEEEDIKVVERNFLVASKAKCSQPWYSSEKMEDHVNQERRSRRASNTSQDTSQGLKMTTDKRSPSRSVTMADTDGHPCRDLPHREMGDKHEIQHTNILGQTETPKTKRSCTGSEEKILFQKNERGEELCSDSDATICDPVQLQGSPRGYTQGCQVAVTAVTEAQDGVFQMHDLNQTEQESEQSQSLLQSLPQCVGDTKKDIVCGGSTPKKKRKKKARGDHGSIEEGKGQVRQSQEEPGGLHTAASVNHHGQKKREKETSITDKCEEDGLETGGTSCKKKKHKNKSMKQSSSLGDTHDVKVSLSDEVLTLEEHVAEQMKKREMMSHGVNTSYAPDKRNKVEYIESTDQDTEQLLKKKKKKKRLEKLGELSNRQASEDTAAQSDEAVSVREKERTSSFLQADSGEKDDQLHQQQRLSSNSVTPGVCDVETESAELAGNSGGVSKKKKNMRRMFANWRRRRSWNRFRRTKHMYGSVLTEMGIKRKKKQKRNESESVASMDRWDGAADEGRSQAEEDIVQRKKKKRLEKLDELSNRQASEDTAAQSDEAVSVREKERTSSFLQADSGEKHDQLHQQQRLSSNSVTPGVCDVETESAELAGNSGGVSKKKKKMRRMFANWRRRRRSWNRFRGTKHMYGSVLTEMGIKRKKKQKRSESESVASVDRWDGAADEGRSQAEEDIVQRKKKKKRKCEEDVMCEDSQANVSRNGES